MKNLRFGAEIKNMALPKKRKSLLITQDDQVEHEPDSFSQGNSSRLAEKSMHCTDVEGHGHCKKHI
jgi:hypothetical protein